MPKDTFFHLYKDKKNKILLAAENEFSNNLLKDASINQIIKNADISRGSFYMYFEDISDLYNYILKDYKEMVFAEFVNIIKRANGKIDKSFLSAFDYFIKLYNNSSKKDLIKNIFLNFKFSSPEFIDAKKMICHQVKGSEILGKEFLKYNSKYNEEYLYEAIRLLVMVTIKMIIEVTVFGNDAREVRKRYEKMLTLIKVGLDSLEEENV